jgi:hypothetical protein
MTINVRTIDASNSHLRYNTNVVAGDTIVEFARFGSVLVNRTVAVAAISAFLAANPDAKITSAQSADNAINGGLRILTQSAISTAIRKPLKTAGTAETIVSAHLPGLTPTNTP